MSKTSIEWCARPGTIPETWNPTTGCNKVSQGCKFCYAEIMHKRLQAMGQKKYQQPFLDGAVAHNETLTIPLKWKKPRTVFVNSMSDLFHVNISFLFIDAVFRVMADINQHTYIILTKRPFWMVEFVKWKKATFGIDWQPSKNVWIGVSVEDQKQADERIPLLLQIPASIRFLSCEPLLGAVNLEAIGYGDQRGLNVLTGETKYYRENNGELDSYWGNAINWVICGGESGKTPRQLNLDNARALRDQCIDSYVPFFFKQIGGKNKKASGRLLDGREWNQWPDTTF